MTIYFLTYLGECIWVDLANKENQVSEDSVLQRQKEKEEKHLSMVEMLIFVGGPFRASI